MGHENVSIPVLIASHTESSVPVTAGEEPFPAVQQWLRNPGHLSLPVRNPIQGIVSTEAKQNHSRVSAQNLIDSA